MSDPAAQIFAIVPAAGRSRRMGRPKLTLEFAGKRVIEHVLSAWKESQVDELIVTVHPTDMELAQFCKRFTQHVVIVDPPPEDMRASIQAGLNYIKEKWTPSDNDVWLLSPADIPLLSTKVIDQVIDFYFQLKNQETHESPLICVPQYDKKNGHPVLFQWELAKKLAELPEDQGANQLAKEFPVQVISVGDPFILKDMDTTEEYERLEADFLQNSKEK